MTLAARVLMALVRLYQLTFAWLLGGHCRFTPSCSHYAIECLRTHGAWRGALHSLRRVSRCHPFSPGGYDPPPPPPPRTPSAEKTHGSENAVDDPPRDRRLLPRVHLRR